MNIFVCRCYPLPTIILENGSSLHESNDILERAMKRYWSKISQNGNGMWHFIRSGENVKTYLEDRVKELGRSFCIRGVGAKSRTYGT